MGKSRIVPPEFGPILGREFGGRRRGLASGEPLASDRNRSLSGSATVHVVATVVLVSVRDALAQVSQGTTEYFRPA
jgi:hypothetical protein